jgi:hypothetical protein
MNKLLHQKMNTIQQKLVALAQLLQKWVTTWKFTLTNSHPYGSVELAIHIAANTSRMIRSRGEQGTGWDGL